MFKEKSSKKRLPLTESCKELTLDARHHRTLDEIAEKRAHVQVLRREHEQFICTYKSIQASIEALALENVDLDHPKYEAAWSSNLRCKDRIRRLEREIASLESCEDEITYFEDTASVLFSYYDLLQHQDAELQPVTHMVALEKPTKSRKKHLPPQNKSILDALNMYNAGQLSGQTSEPTPSLVPALVPATVPESVPESVPKLDKRALVEKYMSLTDPTFVNVPSDDAFVSNCPRCHTQLLCMLQDGIMVCSGCGYQELMLVEQNKPMYRQPSKEASHFSYKRINHFNEWLSQIQGKESTDIPEEIFEKIVREIQKEKIHDASKLTYTKMREILKKLKLNKFYEHGPYIISRINGMPTPNFTPDLEEKLRAMFKEIQGPVLKHCPKDRKNFLSYSYVLYKFFQLLERDEYLKHFPLLKSREKLHLQDQIWKNICEELHWQFIQSI